MSQTEVQLIKDAVIVNADINSSAAIAMSKLALSITNSEINASAAIARTKLANVDLVDDTSPQLGGLLDSNGNGIKMLDSNVLYFGTGNDSAIFHNGTDLKIQNATGKLRIQGAPNEDSVVAIANGKVELYYDNSKKFETVTDGALMTRELRVVGTTVNDFESGRVRFTEAGEAMLGGYIHYDGAANILKIGTHPQSDSTVSNDVDAITMQRGSGTNDVKLLYNGSTKFETQSSGVEITGKLTFSTEGLAGGSIDLGIDADLNLYHDNSDAFFDNNTGDFYIRNDGGSTSEKVRIQAKGGEQSIICNPNGAVELYYDNVKSVETHAQGAAIGSAAIPIPTMNSFSCQILAGASGFLGNYHDGTTNQQLILGLNQYFDSAYKAPTNAVAAHLQIYQRTFRFNTAPAPGSAGGTLSHTQALRIDTDGIKFGTDTAAANALDDYEEGTWTPSVSGTTTNLGSTSGRAFMYRKIGSVVFFNFDFFQENNNMSIGSDVVIDGLPFDSSLLPNNFLSNISVFSIGGTSSAHATVDNYFNNSAKIVILTAVSSSRHFAGQGFYFVA